MTVEAMLARISSREIAEWRAYEQEFGPLGRDRDDWNTALLAHTIASAFGGKEAKKLKLQDFVLDWGSKRKQTPAEQLELLKGLAAKQNKKGSK